MTVGIPMQSLTRYFLPVTCAAAFLYGAEPAPHTSWPAYLGGADSAQYSALKQVTRVNVKQLEVAGTYATGEKGNYLFNPIVVDGVMYVLAKNNPSWRWMRRPAGNCGPTRIKAQSATRGIN